MSNIEHSKNEPVVKYKQKDEDSFCLGSLESAFYAIGDFYAKT